MEVVESTEKSGSFDNSKKRPSSSPEKMEGIQSSNPDLDKLSLLEQEAVTSSKRLRTIPNSPSVAEEAGSESPAMPEKLEVPSKELQCIQKQVLIEKLMATTATPTEEPMDVQSVSKKPVKKNQSKKQSRLPSEPTPKSLEDFRKSFKMRSSSILDRVKVFLPELKNANEELLRLPDPSKISLESDTDEMDGAVAGPSGLSSHSNEEATSNTKAEGNQTYVEMNLALVEQSDSDTSSDDDCQDNRTILNGIVKGLPDIINKKDVAMSSVNSDKGNARSNAIESLPANTDEKTDNSRAPKDVSPEKPPLITELN